MLGSGSAGNSALVSTDHCRILINGGLSARQIVVRLEQCGVAPEQLDGLLLTHEHGDHVCGLEVLAGSLPFQFIATHKRPRPFVASGCASTKTGDSFAPVPNLLSAIFWSKIFPSHTMPPSRSAMLFMPVIA